MNRLILHVKEAAGDEACRTDDGQRAPGLHKSSSLSGTNAAKQTHFFADFKPSRKSPIFGPHFRAHFHVKIFPSLRGASTLAWMMWSMERFSRGAGVGDARMILMHNFQPSCRRVRARAAKDRAVLNGRYLEKNT